MQVPEKVITQILTLVVQRRRHLDSCWAGRGGGRLATGEWGSRVMGGRVGEAVGKG